MPITTPGDFSMSGLRLECPGDCLEIVQNKFLVIGPETQIDDHSNRIYSLESSICGAAIHSGLMNDIEGGSIIMHLTKPRGPFITSNQNKIESKQGIQTEIAAYFLILPPVYDLKCSETLLEADIKLESGKSYYIRCLKGCFAHIVATGAEIIFGNNNEGYSADTAVCKAALHAGYLGDKHDAEFTIL